MAEKSEKRLPPKSQLILDGSYLTTSDIFLAVFDFDLKVVITQETEERIIASRQLLNQLVDDNRVIYGVNTGVGGFVNWLVPKTMLKNFKKI